MEWKQLIAFRLAFTQSATQSINLSIVNAGSKLRGAYLSSVPRGRTSRPSQKSEQASSSTSAMPCENICFIPISHSFLSHASQPTTRMDGQAELA